MREKEKMNSCIIGRKNEQSGENNDGKIRTKRKK
jgi:hypothetical protein